MDVRDVVVVGASFGGLAAAETIKVLNPEINVTVIDAEAKPFPKTTGGIANWWFESLNYRIPKNLLAGEIRGMRIISPSGNEAEFKFEKPVGSVIYSDRWVQHYIDKCIEKRVDFKLGKKVTGLHSNQRLIETPGEYFRADVIIAADGANSFLGRKVGRPGIEPMDIHVGYEHTIKACNGWNNDYVHLIIDPKIAPQGYAWYFPEGYDKARVGLGVPKGLGLNPRNLYYEELCKKYPEFGGAPVKTLSGQIPTAPLLKSNVSGNILFVGDAGRFCSPLHGGGIGFAVISGYLAGGIVADLAPKGGDWKIFKRYDREWKSDLGGLLKRHYRLKKVIYGFSTKDWDDAIQLMSKFKLKSMNPNKEILRFVRVLALHKPFLLPRLLKVLL